ncbi:MAG TPA: Mor transcription activator family protein [Candidatus Binataceae bacterium]|nr:Mor transcription activator family protein [Candidatus Binataceae bacterium]
MLDSITAVIGAAAAASLVAEFGGRRLYVPHTPRPEDVLVRILGAKTAALFARHFGGDRIVMPADPERAHRRERIIEARRKGLSISAVARETGCTERYVYKVLAQQRQG